MRGFDQPNQQWSGEGLGPGTSSAPYRIYNIENSEPVELDEFIAILDDTLGKKTIRNPLPLQQADVPTTFAEVSDLEHDIGFKPKAPLREGIRHFVDWYQNYYGPDIGCRGWEPGTEVCDIGNAGVQHLKSAYFLSIVHTRNSIC